MATIKHAKTATGANDPTRQISVDAWNAGHVIENDIAAAAGGVRVGGIYRNGSVLMVRVS